LFLKKKGKKDTGLKTVTGQTFTQIEIISINGIAAPIKAVPKKS